MRTWLLVAMVGLGAAGCGNCDKQTWGGGTLTFTISSLEQDPTELSYEFDGVPQSWLDEHLDSTISPDEPLFGAFGAVLSEYRDTRAVEAILPIEDPPWPCLAGAETLWLYFHFDPVEDGPVPTWHVVFYGPDYTDIYGYDAMIGQYDMTTETEGRISADEVSSDFYCTDEAFDIEAVWDFDPDVYAIEKRNCRLPNPFDFC